LAEKTIAIIGAGIAGLSAGCYARMNGFDVDIYETHDKPGGMCTSWRRKDYVFDYCIHNLGGTSPKSGLHKVWRELGALEDRGVINHDEFVTIEVPEGEAVHWYADLDRLGAHLKSISPADSTVIDEMIGAARRLAKADLFSMALGGKMRMLRALPHLSLVKRWSQVTIGEYARLLQSPVLRRAIRHMMYDIPGDEVPMMAVLMFAGGLGAGDLGWPTGGSLAFSEAVEKRFIDLGGRLHYKSKVEKILVKHKRAVGILLADGSEKRADYVVSAADGYSTLYGMLEGKYVTRPIKRYYDSAGDIGPFGLMVYLGLKSTRTDAPHALTLVFDEPLDVGGLKQDSVHAVYYAPETGLAPKGKSVLKIEVQAKYSYWKERRDADLKAYRDEKTRVAERVIDRISPRFPGIREQIDMMDVCTPPTAERYTGNRFGWQPGPARDNAEEVQRHGLSKTLPGLAGFYHVGQWSDASLGVSSVAISGRNMVKDLCKAEGKKFTASTC
jgi:phytoene dehydrogenase-like protein